MEYMKQHPLITAFTQSIEKNELIDSSSAFLSDDESVLTYSVSKFYHLEGSSSFNLVSFFKEFKKNYKDYEIESSDDGLILTKQYGQFELKYELEVYDGALKLEVFTTDSADQSVEVVQDLSKFLLAEFTTFNSLLFKNNH